jgi:hypothetical protein
MFPQRSNPHHPPSILLTQKVIPPLDWSLHWIGRFTTITLDWHGWDDPVADIEDGDSNSDDCLSYFSEDGLGATIPVIIPTSQSTTKFPKSDLRSYWKKATTDEKVEMNNQGFEMLRNIQEVNALEAVHQAQRKVSRLRAQARDRQQHHRDGSHEKKINEGWLPGQKRVSLTFFSHS